MVLQDVFGFVTKPVVLMVFAMVFSVIFLVIIFSRPVVFYNDILPTEYPVTGFIECDAGFAKLNSADICIPLSEYCPKVVAGGIVGSSGESCDCPAPLVFNSDNTACIISTGLKWEGLPYLGQPIIKGCSFGFVPENNICIPLSEYCSDNFLGSVPKADGLGCDCPAPLFFNSDNTACIV